MADTSLRIGIDSTPAEAGARRVIASLRQIQQEAARTVGITVPVKIDTSGIASAIAQANQAIRGLSKTAVEIKVPIGFDTGDIGGQTADLTRRIRAEIDRAVGQGIPVETSLKVVTEAAEAEIRRVLGRDLPSAEATLEVATDTAESEIRRVLSQIGGSVGVSIEVFSDEARAEIERFVAQSDVPVDVLLDVLTSPAAAEITRFINEDRPAVDVDVDVGSATAEAEIDRLVSEMAQTVRVSLTADAAPAQAEIDRVLSASMRVVELLVEADTAAAIEAVNRVRSEASDPIEVPLNVSIENAEARISQLLGEAQQSIDIAVNVSAGDTTSDIDRILSGAPETVEIPVEVAIQEAEARIDRLLAKAREDIEIAVNITNTTNEDDDVGKWRSRASRPVRVPVEANTEEADRQVDRLLSEAEKSVEIPVTADTAQVKAEIDNLASTDKPTLNVIVGADTISFDTTVAGIAAAVPPAVEIPVSVDGDDARAEIDRLADTLGARLPEAPKVTVDADVSGVVAAADEAADALAGIGDAADLSGLTTEARKAATSLSAIEAAAKKAGDAADDMSDAFKNATREVEALELVGEALLAISTSIIEAITAFEDYEDAVKAATGSTAAAEMAMAMLEEFALSTSVSIEDVTAAFVELRTNGLEASKDALTSYGNVAAGLNLTMEELAQAVGDAAERNFSKLNETQLKAKESGDKVIFTYHGMKTEVDNSSKAIAGFIKQMGNTEFAGSMQDAVDGVNGAFEAMSEAWRELARDMGEGGLSEGLENFALSMAAASENAEELGRILGGWLGNQAELLGRDIEGIVDQLNDLVDIFEKVTGAINSIPSLSDVFDSDFMRRAMPALYGPREAPDTPEQGPPENPTSVEARAFGSDTNQPRKPKRTRKTDAQRQAETFARETAENKEMIRTLVLMDEAYERGRGSVEGFRNSVEELTARQAAQKSVGKENAEAMMEQWAEIKGLQENIAIKGEVLDQQEAIMQTVALAEAYKDGSAAVDQAEASQKAWNTAVQLGVTGSPDLIAQFTELAAAAQVANDNLALEQDLSGMNQQIEAATRMGEAYKAGGGAIREAALEQEVYAIAAANGKEHDEEATARIREKMTALRDLTEARQADERAMAAGFDIEQSTLEIENLRLTGEEYLIASERLSMLMQKKRETNDVTATLTPQEEALAVSLGQVAYQARLANDALSQLANDGRNTEMIFRDMAAQGLGHFEDALVDIVTGAKSAREAFADMAKSIAADLARMAIRMAIIQPLAMMFGGMMGGGAGMVASNVAVGATSTAFNLGGGGQQWHTGGIVGQDSAPFRSFATLPKFHTGGLATNETPAVLQKGEGVFTAAQMRALAPANGNSTGMTNVIHINVTAPPGSDRGAAENQANLIAKTVRMAVDERIEKATRNGGILNANGGY